MYCMFATCMYVHMLMYMYAYICVCMHVYVIYGSEGLRTMWDFKQTQKTTLTHFKRPTGNPDNRILAVVKPVVTLELSISS